MRTRIYYPRIIETILINSLVKKFSTELNKNFHNPNGSTLLFSIEQAVEIGNYHPFINLNACVQKKKRKSSPVNPQRLNIIVPG